VGLPARRARRDQHIGRQWRPAYRWALSGAIAAIVLAVITAALSHADEGTAGLAVDDLSDPIVSLLWQARTGKTVTSAPVTTGTGVFVGGADGVIRRFAKSDGALIWT
jgi:hypothetical protein